MEQQIKPEGTTHKRLNLKKTRMNFFKIEGGVAEIWNNGRWEPFSGNVLSLEPIDASKKSADLSRIKKSPKKDSPVKTDPMKHDGLFANSLSEEAINYIPSPVLRQLIEHYKNDDIVEVEIRVKSTHIIKG